jgi:3-oxoacyl-[acyl-carrier-protein] synthase II
MPAAWASTFRCGPESPRMASDVWITGCGLISTLGEGRQAHWLSLGAPSRWQDRADSATFAPHTIYPMVPLDLDRFIPRKADQRAMGPMMHYGCYAAGMALAEARIAGEEALLARTHLIAASPGGERDIAVDEQILAAFAEKPNADDWLNGRLAADLRPTLFLAQLPNLLAGNISIVHGVAGSSRTFLGEESAGVDAVRIAFERIAAGQGDLFLVGGAFNAARPDTLLMLEPYGLLHGSPVPALWRRPAKGIALGSAGAFLVMESREHAQARGTPALARLCAVEAGHSGRSPGSAAREAASQWDKIGGGSRAAVGGTLSGACGAGLITAEEHDFLSRHDGLGPVRGTAGALGHSMEASFFANLALAITCLEQGRMFATLAPDEPIEARRPAAADRIVVTGWGHHRGEGMALIERIG